MSQRLIVILVSMCVLGGCAGVQQGRPARVSYEDVIVNTLIEKYSKSDAIPADQTKIIEKERNQILGDLIFLTDVNYYKFETELYQGKATFDTATDIAILGLGLAGGIVTYSGTQAIISAISGGIGGTRVSINKNFFHDQSTQALIAKMQSVRKSKLDLMRKAMTLSMTDYPLTQGLSDVAEYYNAGSIVGALQNIVSDAGAETKKAEASLAETITSKYKKDAASEIIRKFWMPDGKNINAENEAKLKAWMKENQLESASIPFFLYSEIYKDARAKAVTDLNLSK